MVKDLRSIDFTVESNRKKYEEEFEKVVEKILTELGMQAESAAKKLCPVDTGLLRNSITWAIAGESANISSYKAQTGSGQGTYSGDSPEVKGQHAVHIGSNVEYAMVQEVGTIKHKDGFSPFLRPAINNNIEYFKNIIETELKNAVVDDFK